MLLHLCLISDWAADAVNTVVVGKGSRSFEGVSSLEIKHP